MSVPVRDNRKSDPLWARGFTRLFDIIIENTTRLGLTSHQIRMILVLNLLAFRGHGTTYHCLEGKGIEGKANERWKSFESSGRVCHINYTAGLRHTGDTPPPRFNYYYHGSSGRFPK